MGGSPHPRGHSGPGGDGGGGPPLWPPKMASSWRRSCLRRWCLLTAATCYLEKKKTKEKTWRREKNRTHNCPSSLRHIDVRHNISHRFQNSRRADALNEVIGVVVCTLGFAVHRFRHATRRLYRVDDDETYDLYPI